MKQKTERDLLLDVAEAAEDVANLFSQDAAAMDSDPEWQVTAVTDLRARLDALHNADGEDAA